MPDSFHILLWILAGIGIILLIAFVWFEYWYNTLTPHEEKVLSLIPQTMWVTSFALYEQLEQEEDEPSIGHLHASLISLEDKGHIYSRGKRNTDPIQLAQRGGRPELEYRRTPKHGRFQRVLGENGESTTPPHSVPR